MTRHSAPIFIRQQPADDETFYTSITLNQPQKRNALDLATLDALIRRLRAGAAGRLLLTGTDPAFCAGLDLREILEMGSPQRHLRGLIALLGLLSDYPGTTIGYVNGPVRAGGVALACCLDYVVAHPAATFLIPGETVYHPMASLLGPIIAARRRLRPEDADGLPGRLLSAHAAKSEGLIDELSENRDQAAARVFASGGLRAAGGAFRTIDPAVCRLVHRRLARALQADQVNRLLDHLRERFGHSG